MFEAGIEEMARLSSTVTIRALCPTKAGSLLAVTTMPSSCSSAESSCSCARQVPEAAIRSDREASITNGLAPI